MDQEKLIEFPKNEFITQKEKILKYNLETLHKALIDCGNRVDIIISKIRSKTDEAKVVEDLESLKNYIFQCMLAEEFICNDFLNIPLKSMLDSINKEEE